MRTAYRVVHHSTELLARRGRPRLEALRSWTWRWRGVPAYRRPPLSKTSTLTMLITQVPTGSLFCDCTLVRIVLLTLTLALTLDLTLALALALTLDLTLALALALTLALARSP